MPGYKSDMCACGHRAERHEIEPPYPCHECGCASFDVLDGLDCDDESFSPPPSEGRSE